MLGNRAMQLLNVKFVTECKLVAMFTLSIDYADKKL